MKRWAVPLALLLILGAALDNRWALLQATHGRLRTMHDTAIFVNMSEHLADGLGVYQRGIPGDPYHYETHARLVGYFQNDVGLSLLYWLARRLFPGPADPSRKLVWLQIATDLLNVLLIFWLARRLLGGCRKSGDCHQHPREPGPGRPERGSGIGGCPHLSDIRADAAGLVAAGLYAGFEPVCRLCVWPYYHFWAGAFALWNLCLLAVLLQWQPRGGGKRHPMADTPLPARLAWGMAGGAFLGLATLVRSVFLPVGLLDAALVLARWRRRWTRALPLVGGMLLLQGAVAVMLMARAHARFGTWSAPRPVWHQIYVSIGTYGNPYGITWSDGAGFSAGDVNGGDYWDMDKLGRYEANLRARVLAIARAHPWLLPRNALLRAGDALSLAFSDPGWLLGGRRRVDGRGCEWYVLALMVVQIVYFVRVFRTEENAWLFGAVLVQTGFFVGSLSWITPPLYQYNVAYYPAFLLGCTVAMAALTHAMRWALGWSEGEMGAQAADAVAARAGPAGGPAAGGATRRLMLLAGGWAAALCWLYPWTGSPLDAARRWAYFAAVPAAMAALLPVASGWLEARRARAAGVGVAGAAALAALAWGHVPPAFLLGWDPRTAIPQIAAGAVGVWLLLVDEPVGLAVAMLTVGTRFHPEVVLLPLALMALLRPAWAARTEVLGRACGASGWAAPLGLAAVAVARLAGWPYVDPVAAWGPLLFVAGCAAARAVRWPAGARLAVAAILLLMRWQGYSAWPVLGILLAVAWLLERKTRFELATLSLGS